MCVFNKSDAKPVFSLIFFVMFDPEVPKSCVFIYIFDFFDFLGLSNVAGLLWGGSATFAVAWKSQKSQWKHWFCALLCQKCQKSQ